MNKSSNSSGQILLITLLAILVLTTIGLALIGRVRVDTTTTADIEESLRAFNAAEAGIEEALRSGVGTAGVVQLSDNPPISYKTEVRSVNESGNYFAFPRFTSQGESETFWLIDRDENQAIRESPFYTREGIKVCWKKRGSGTTEPAISIAILYKRGQNYRIARAAFDPDPSRDNNFSEAGSIGNGCGQTDVYAREIRFSEFSPPINFSSPNPDVLIFLRIRPLYADAFLFIEGEGSLPSQGNMIVSTGATGFGVSRKIIAIQSFRAPRGIFDATIISQTSFSK